MAKKALTKTPTMVDELPDDDGEMSHTGGEPEEDVAPVRRFNFKKKLTIRHAGWWQAVEGEVVEFLLIKRQIAGGGKKNDKGEVGYEYIGQLLSDATIVRPNAKKGADDKAIATQGHEGEIVSFRESKALEPLRDLLQTPEDSGRYAIQLVPGKIQKTRESGRKFRPIDIAYDEVK